MRTYYIRTLPPKHLFLLLQQLQYISLKYGTTALYYTHLLQYVLQCALLRGRPTLPAVLAQKGKIHQIIRPSGQRSMIA